MGDSSSEFLQKLESSLGVETPQEEKPRTNNKALWGAILGIVGMVLFVAIVLIFFVSAQGQRPGGFVMILGAVGFLSAIFSVSAGFTRLGSSSDDVMSGFALGVGILSTVASGVGVGKAGLDVAKARALEAAKARALEAEGTEMATRYPTKDLQAAIRLQSLARGRQARQQARQLATDVETARAAAAGPAGFLGLRKRWAQRGLSPRAIRMGEEKYRQQQAVVAARAAENVEAMSNLPPEYGGRKRTVSAGAIAKNLQSKSTGGGKKTAGKKATGKK